jgi:DNA-binding IscR family transcriptional regulator
VTFGDFIEVIEGHALAFTDCLRESEEDCRCVMIGRCNIITPMHRFHERLMEFLRGVRLSELLVDETLAGDPTPVKRVNA